MPRTKSDILDDIADIKGSVSSGVCVWCDKKCSGEKKIKSFDIHNECYNKNVNLSENKLVPGTLGELLKELERI